MLPPVSGSSVSSELLGVVHDFNGIERSVNPYSETVELLLTSFVFLIPAFAAWRMARFWHAWLFALLALVAAAYHSCDGGIGHASGCDQGTRLLVTQLHQMWSSYCFLQTAFVVLGPEDPQMHYLGDPSDRHGLGDSLKDISAYAASGAVAIVPSGAASGAVPVDVIVVSRIVPVVVLFFFHFFHESVEIDGVRWEGLLLNEVLLVFCTATFWMHHQSRSRVADVLVRFRYWYRLLHHGFIPALMLFWIYCIMGFADCKALHSMWHTVVASFAVSIFRAVIGDAGTASTAKIVDVGYNNPFVAHLLLGSVTLLVIPTALAGASFDWCSTGEWYWPTISMAMSCQPGGYFVAMAALPAFTAAGGVFMLIESTVTIKGPWCSGGSTKRWEQHDCDLRQLALGRRLGCMLGYGGAALGLASCLVMKGSPAQNVANLFGSLVSIILLMVAMCLTVLSSEPDVPGLRFRRRITLLVCMPFLALQVLLMLVGQCLPSKYEIPHSVYALTEYTVILLLVVWPLTWAAEVQEVWQQKSSGLFLWPKTSWRFA